MKAMLSSVAETKEIKINNDVLEFKIIPLIVEKKNISNLFYKKKNKTLKQTIEQPRYACLKFDDKYPNHLDDKLGDFLKFLKEKNNSDYKQFLNKYGDKEFCEFKINTCLDDKGIYCFIKDNEIKYIGRCTDNFKKRINQGYGKICPKNCFKDGQATNCHINSLINDALIDSAEIKFGVCIRTDKSTEEIKELEKYLLKHNSYEWNIQTS